MRKYVFGKIDSSTLCNFFDPDEPLDMHDVLISSPGGDVGSMLAMYDYIVESESSTIATGVVQSAAAVLLQAGAKRYMTKNALLLFHEPDRQKNEKGQYEIPDQDWALYDHLVNIVANRVGMHVTEAFDLFDGKFIDAAKALHLGLIDEVIDSYVVVPAKEIPNDGNNS